MVNYPNQMTFDCSWDDFEGASKIAVSIIEEAFVLDESEKRNRHAELIATYAPEQAGVEEVSVALMDENDNVLSEQSFILIITDAPATPQLVYRTLTNHPDMSCPCYVHAQIDNISPNVYTAFSVIDPNTLETYDNTEVSPQGYAVLDANDEILVGLGPNDFQYNSTNKAFFLASAKQAAVKTAMNNMTQAQIEACKLNIIYNVNGNAYQATENFNYY